MSLEVAEENESGRRVINFCEERGMCKSETFFDLNGIHKYTRVVVGEDFTKVKNITDFILVKMLKYMMGVKSMKRLEMGILDHCVVLCMIKLVGAWAD